MYTYIYTRSTFAVCLDTAWRHSRRRSLTVALGVCA